MPYTPQTWTNGVSKLNATRMTVIETGIDDATATADAAIAGTIVNAKGDLITASAADTPAILTVGANNTVLVADSAQTTGNKWANITNSMVDAAAAITYSKLSLTGSIVNADISASAAIDLSKITVPRAVARRTTDLTVSNNTWTLVAWDAEDEDTDTIHSTSSNTARLTATTAGLYQFNCFLSYASNTTGIRGIVVQKNSEALPATAGVGTYVGGFVQSAPSTAISLTLGTSGIVRLAATDYIATVTFQDSGGNLAVDKDDSYFEMHRIAA